MGLCQLGPTMYRYTIIRACSVDRVNLCDSRPAHALSEIALGAALTAAMLCCNPGSRDATSRKYMGEFGTPAIVCSSITESATCSEAAIVAAGSLSNTSDLKLGLGHFWHGCSSFIVCSVKSPKLMPGNHCPMPKSLDWAPAGASIISSHLQSRFCLVHAWCLHDHVFPVICTLVGTPTTRI